MSVLDFYQWADKAPLGAWIRGETYAFPLIEVVHLFAITVMLGTICTVNFRLFGLALKSRPVAEVAQGLAPWTLGGYIVTFGTGVMLFSAEALKCYGNDAWAPKLFFLFGGVIVQHTLYRSVIKPGRAEANPRLAKLTAVLSTLFWFGTGMAGRAIGFT